MGFNSGFKGLRKD